MYTVYPDSIFEPYIVLLYFRAGKGVFSAMKLGKVRSSKDNHKKGTFLFIYSSAGIIAHTE